MLLASLRSFQNGAIREHKEQCYAGREQLNESLKVLLEGLERGLVSTLTTIGSITEDRALSDVENFITRSCHKRAIPYRHEHIAEAVD